MALDTDKTYRHAEMPGVAWLVVGPEIVTEYDSWEDEYTETSTGMVIAVMVGDNRRHVVDPDDLVEIDEDDVCWGCGQIGCGH